MENSKHYLHVILFKSLKTCNVVSKRNDSRRVFEISHSTQLPSESAHSIHIPHIIKRDGGIRSIIPSAHSSIQESGKPRLSVSLPISGGIKFPSSMSTCYIQSPAVMDSRTVFSEDVYLVINVVEPVSRCFP